MRIVIVGAGIAGLTLAALLERRGLRPVVVDRAPDFAHAGYMLALYPIGSRVLHGLGLFERFIAASEPLETYRMCNGRGEPVHDYDLGSVTRQLGPIRQLSREALLELLRSAARGADLRMSTAVESARPAGDIVELRLSDGTELAADLLVGADGIHSDIRNRLVGPAARHDTRWGAWVWWADAALAPHDTITEYWGAGRFVGIYPTRERIGVIAGGPVAQIGAEALDGGAEALRAKFAMLAQRLQPLFAAMPGRLDKMFFWRLEDCRAAAWHKDRTVLVGDSACGFLPTAGVGASMAMESAAVLADELDRTDAHYLPNALALYEKRRRRRAEAAQEDSRKLAAMMFVESLPVAWGRDQIMKFYSLEMLAKQIAKSLEEPI